MYIEGFHIAGFGVFNNVRVSNISPAINIFYGNNEAGKSTCMNFLRAMLTGYPAKNSKKTNGYYEGRSGGQQGGSLFLRCAGPEGRSITLYRSSGRDSLSLTDENNRPIAISELERLLNGIDAEIYNNIFGFSLSELEKFAEKRDGGAREALLGASFGANLNSPAKLLSDLIDKKNKFLSQRGGSLRKYLKELEETNREIMNLASSSESFDALFEEKEEAEKIVQDLHDRKKKAEKISRQLERRLSVWHQWTELQSIKLSLAHIQPVEGIFPENARESLGRIQEVIHTSEDNLQREKGRLKDIQDKISALDYNHTLLDNLPELNRLAERKTSYRQAFSQLPALQKARERALENLEHNLSYLGDGWDCDRIRNTDKSLFAQEHIGAIASEMTAASLTHQTFSNNLEEANSEVHACEKTYSDARHAMEKLPVITADLNDDERDEIRKSMIRLEECRRLAPERNKALATARENLERDLGKLKVHNFLDDKGEIDTKTVQEILNEITSTQPEASAIKSDIKKMLASADELENEIKRALNEEERIKKKIEDIRIQQLGGTGSSRENIKTKMNSLQELRRLAAKIPDEKEKIEELQAQIETEGANVIAPNWLIIVCSLLFFLAGAGIFLASKVWHLSELTLGEELMFPINLWIAYFSFFCGALLLAVARPGRNREKERHINLMSRLQTELSTLRSRLLENEEKADKNCALLEIDGYDDSYLEACELRLEREKQRMNDQERWQKENAELNVKLAEARDNLASLRQDQQNIEHEIQHCRKQWHLLMQRLSINANSLPEDADIMLERAESARIALANLNAAREEVDALWSDMNILEESVAQMPAIARRLEDSPETLNLVTAVKLTLDACREADAVRDRKLACEASLEAASAALNRARDRQQEAAKQLEQAAAALESARKKWGDQLKGIGLKETYDPETVRQAFKYMENCLGSEKEAEKASEDIVMCQEELSSLQQPLGNLLEQLEIEPVLNSDKNVDWLLSLDQLLHEANASLKISNEKTSLANQLDAQKAVVRDVEITLATARSREKELFQQAHVETAEDFFRQAELRNRLEKLIEDRERLENYLTITAGEQPLEEFLETFREEGKEDQEARLTELALELENIENQEKEISAKIGDLSRRIADMSQTTALAEQRQKASQITEDITRDYREWSKLAVAGALLAKAKKVFQEEQQPEVIKEASAIFSRITNGKWRGIMLTLDDVNPLVLISAAGEPVPPAMLSRGALEQTYLSLRLAFISRHARTAEPLPVIMDEILVNFDPERAARSARTFSDLATARPDSPQQFLYFTCHPYMVDLLREAAPGCACFEVQNEDIKPL